MEESNIQDTYICYISGQSYVHAFRNFFLMRFHERDLPKVAGLEVPDSGGRIAAGGGEFSALVVKREIEHLVLVAAQGRQALAAHPRVPDPRGFVQRAARYQRLVKVVQTVGYLLLVADQHACSPASSEYFIAHV